jgi:hypothetical protein
MGPKRNDLFIIVVLMALAVGFQIFYWVKFGYQFDWDQERDALMVSEIINQRKFTLIGPRVANENGFFNGPYHYYFLLPFFLVTGGNPMSGAGLGLLMAALTVMAYYYVGLKLWNRQTGFLAAFVYVLSGQLVIWNAMYGPLLAVVGFYLIFQAMNGKIKWIWPATLAGLAANIHLVPASISISLLIGLLLARKKPSVREQFQMVFVYLIWFLPLLIFDLRHDFLNIKKAMELVNGNSVFVWDRARFFRVWWRAWNVFNLTAWNSEWRYLIDRILAVLCLALGWIWIGHDKKFKIFTISWLLVPMVLLFKYKGNLPEYYFQVGASLLPLIFASLVARIRWLTLLTVILLVINLPYARIAPLTVTLADKLTLVDYLVNQKQDKYFNVSYSLPLGQNNGYEYLFRWRGALPDRSNRGHLYTMVGLPTDDKGNLVVTSGPIGLIRR